MKKNIKLIEEAINVIDNEGLKLRDEIKKTNKKSDKIQQRILYKLKDETINKLYREKLIYTEDYYIQKIGERKQKLFINKIVGGNGTEIYTLRPYKGQEDCFDKIDEIGRIEHKKLNSDLTLNKAIEIIKVYIKNKEYEKKKNNKSNKKLINKVKETKLVELSRLRVVRDVHINGNLSSTLTEQRRNELKEMLANNKNKYPKEEAILVHKSKDPEDKRRVIYNIEDGYRRFLLAGEFGLDKVYVDIIDE